MSYVVAKYLRISDEDIDIGRMDEQHPKDATSLDGLTKQESNSIGGQRALLDDFISNVPEFAGCEVIEALDDGRTGTNFSRPGAQQLIEMAEQGKVQCIIVKDLSRWGRNYIEVGDFLEQKFPAWGVRFISIGDNYDSAKLNYGTSGIDIGFRNLIYDLYSQDLSVKSRSGKDAATRAGKIICTYPTFGYDKDKNDRHKFVIDPIDAPIVNRIFDLAEKGKSVADIVKILNADDVPTKQISKHRKGYKFQWGRGDLWDNSAVLDTLRNECYTGKWIYGKTRTTHVGSRKTKKIPRSEWIIVPNAIPALVTEEQFMAVQEKLDAAFKGSIKKKADNSDNPPRTIFAGLVKCARCDRVLDYQSRATQIGAFYCKTPKRSDKFGCTTAKIDERVLIDTVLAVLQHQIALANVKLTTGKQEVYPIKSTLQAIHMDIQNLQKLLEQAKLSKIRLWESYNCNKISKEKFQADSKALTEQISAYEVRASELSIQTKEASTQDDDSNKLAKQLVEFSGLQVLTREIILKFVDKIKVYNPEHIEIVWKYRDAFEKFIC